MLELLYKLTALQIYCKDAHYAFSGTDFKPLHEWVDEISDPVYDWLDELKEHYYLYQGFAVPRGTDINEKAKDYVPTELGTNADMLKSILAILSMVHADIISVNGSSSDMLGLSDILGKIDNHIMKHMGLINLALAKKKVTND